MKHRSDLTDEQIEAQLYALVAQGMLDVEHNDEGDPRFKLTARGTAYVEHMISEAS